MPHADFDLVILGGGPAGSATAITAARAGLTVAVLERSRFPRHRPGETLHPGVEPLLRQLGVADQVLKSDLVRHRGTWVAWGATPRFEPFGTDAHGEWRGYQAPREELDARLLDAAARAGAQVEQGIEPWSVIQESGRAAGVQVGTKPWRARFVIDAAGDRHHLARHLGLPVTLHSPRLVARFGYVRGTCPVRHESPLIEADDFGWTWTARIGETRYQWTRLDLRPGRLESTEIPIEFRELDVEGPTRGADVTWRLVAPVAGPGYFLVGDAAAVLDPSSSHGVIRALMTGMMAGFLARKVIVEQVPEEQAARHYIRWLEDWFRTDCDRLRRLWAEIPAWKDALEGLRK